MLGIESEQGIDTEGVPEALTVRPRQAAGPWARRTVAAVALAAVFFGVLLVRSWGSGSESTTPSRSIELRAMPTSAAIEAKYGVRFIGVEVTSAGGMIQIRYQVLDSAKTQAIHTEEATPTVVDGAGNEYNLPGMPGHAHIGAVKTAGTTDFVLLANAKGGVKSGVTVTIRIGGLELHGVPVS